MAKWEVAKVERADNKAYKVIILCDGLEISFVPQIVVSKLKEKKIARESSRIYLYGGELTKDKLELDKATERGIREQAWAILFGEKKKKKIRAPFIPNEKAIRDEANSINKSIKLLKIENPSKTWTELLEVVLRKKAEVIIIHPREFNYINVFKRDLIFKLNKAGLKVTKEGWIIIYRNENGLKYKSIVFNLDSAIRMQDDILNAYLFTTKNFCAEVPKIKELQKMVEEVNKLLIDWSGGKKKKEIKERISTLIGKLSAYRNSYKVDSKNLLESIVNLNDSLARENPGAFAAKTVAVINRLEKRLEEKKRITPIIEKRKKLLREYKSALTTEKMRAIRDLDKFINIRNFSYYADVNPIKINKILYILDDLILAPFSAQKMQACFYLQSARDCITETKKAKKDLRTALAILQS